MQVRLLHYCVPPLHVYFYEFFHPCMFKATATLALAWQWPVWIGTPPPAAARPCLKGKVGQGSAGRNQWRLHRNVHCLRWRAVGERGSRAKRHGLVSRRARGPRRPSGPPPPPQRRDTPGLGRHASTFPTPALGSQSRISHARLKLPPSLPPLVLFLSQHQQMATA